MKTYTINRPIGEFKITYLQFTDRLNGRWLTEWEVKYDNLTQLIHNGNIYKSSQYNSYVIDLGSFGDIINKINKGNRILITIDEETYKDLQTVHNENMKKLEEKRDKETTIKYNLNDTASYGIYNGFSQFDETLIHHIKKIEKKLDYDLISYEGITKHLNRIQEIKDLAYDTYKPYPISNPELKYNDGTYKYTEEHRIWLKKAIPAKAAEGFGSIPIDVILSYVEQYIADKKNRELEIDKKSADYKKKILQKAVDTNESQILHQSYCDCYDPGMECNTDIITTYIKPDGTTYKNRTHTY